MSSNDLDAEEARAWVAFVAACVARGSSGLVGLADVCSEADLLIAELRKRRPPPGVR